MLGTTHAPKDKTACSALHCPHVHGRRHMAEQAFRDIAIACALPWAIRLARAAAMSIANAAAKCARPLIAPGKHRVCIPRPRCE